MIKLNNNRIFERLEVQSFNSQAYKKIRQAIVSGIYPPGTRLVAFDLASQLGTSPAPIKEAITKLAGEHLVEVRPRIGTFVTQLKSKDIKEFFEVRLLIEQFAAEQIIEKVTNAQLTKLRRMVEDLCEHINGDNYINFPQYIEKDHNFHWYFVSLSGNSRLIEIYENLGAHLIIARAYFVKHIAGAQRAHAEHITMVNALENGDLVSLQGVIREHITLGMSNVLQAMSTTVKEQVSI
jgi:DNA-binding GntR family transcriptional regulator